MGSISLYYHTVKDLKLSQVINRIRIRMGRGCSLGISPSDNYSDIRTLDCPRDLDFDPVFIARFPVTELMDDTITFLHSSKKMQWKSTWEFEEKEALWNYNLHYFEYLFPLVKAWKETGEKKYIDKCMEIISGWIDGNPKGTSPAWSSYTTALRIVTWISFFGYVKDDIEVKFKEKFMVSLHEQYVYLAGHLEKDILGNHYFEDLKSLVLASIFFNDNAVFKKAFADFKLECKEEILPDGMHFELSPMYHKIIFEGILRIVLALRSVGQKDDEIEALIQPMLDVAYSLEKGLKRIPLFNDGGNNVAKSLESLVKVAKNLGYLPNEKNCFESCGYYIFQKKIGDSNWKMVVDAGQPGPQYIPGHSHCDAMSFELFCNGNPVVVNCGTYGYQCKERTFYRSTAAHNTVMIDGIEQSQCWSRFRLAKRSKVRILKTDNCSIKMEMTDYTGQTVVREIRFSNSTIRIIDQADGHNISSFIHVLSPISIESTVSRTEYEQLYAVDYGYHDSIKTIEFSGKNTVDVIINLMGEMDE